MLPAFRFVIACCMATCLSTHALAWGEDGDTKPFSGGLILGTNFSQIDGDTYYGYHKIGLNTGATVYIHFTSKFGISMELLYSQKGSHAEDVVESPTVGTYVTQYNIKANYVDLPITFHYIWRDVDFEAGASYARLIKSDEWAYSEPPIYLNPVINAFNTSDINYVFGASHKLYKQLYGNFRFQYSFATIRPLASIPPNYAWGYEGQFNNLVSFRLMYYF